MTYKKTITGCVRMLAALSLILLILVPGSYAAGQEKIRIKVLILPKFEVGEMTGDYPGEAQFYYEGYLDGGETYEIPGTAGDGVLYVKDGVALCLLGMGKVSAAMETMAVLSDERFDFSDACIISTGCAGSAQGYGIMGDVFVITAAVDSDLGHHADIREMQEDTAATWFHDESFDGIAAVMLDQDLTDQVYDLVKDVPVETTARTRAYMREAFDGAAWAVRNPRVLKGTTVTGDNYWKGEYDHENAVLMTKTYGCPDPYALTEMEDVAVAAAVRRMGLLDHFIILRDSVNMDVFMCGATPESLWDPSYEAGSLTSEDSIEAADIFETAMKNNFAAGSVIIEAVLNGKLKPFAEEASLTEDPFAAWNPKAASLKVLKDYVKTVTDEASRNFIPESERIAVFDLDGTLYGELFPACLEYYMLAWRILKDPGIEPDDEMLALGKELRESVNRNSFAEDLPARHAVQAARAYTGMTLKGFSDYVDGFLLRDADGFEGMTYQEAFYLPMLEVIDYLNDNGFICYVVSGGDRFLCRTLLKGTVKIPDERIIGTDVELEAAGQNGRDGLDYVYIPEEDVVRTDRLLGKNLKMNKVRQIVQEIGRQPVLSFGNSSDDCSMHNYTLSNETYKSAAFMLIADDEERDYGNAGKAEELKNTWEESGYTVISMRDDFRTIYGDDVVKTGSFRWAEELNGGREEREMPADETETEKEDAGTAKETGPGKIFYVTARRLNVRAGASANDRILGTLNQGDEVQVIKAAEEKGWYQIRYQDAEAYVSAAYLSEKKPA